MSEGLRQRRGAGSSYDQDEDASKKRKGIGLETFDLYQKVQADEAVQTRTGAGVSLISYIVIALLVLSELYGYFVPKIQEHMLVDSVIEGRLRIDFDITFPALHCGEVNLDAMDVAGEQQNGIDHDITKTRLGADDMPIGSSFAASLASKNVTEEAPLPADYCGSCYGAASKEGQCCNTCEEVRQAYADKGWDSTDVLRDSEQCKRDSNNPNGASRPGEGCRIAGMMTVNKVAGNFHIAMGETHARGAGHIHQFNPMQILRYNVTHTIHKLSFGEQLTLEGSSGVSSYKQRGPLDGVQQTPAEGAGVYMYYVKVIPTVYSRGGNQPNMTTNQYSVTRQYRPAVYNGQRQNVLPGVFFVYDVSPFMVRITAHTAPLADVLTNLCAILGGVIAAATLVDQVLYRLTKAAKVIGKGEGDGSGARPVPPMGGAQGALVDALAGAVTQVQRAANVVQYGAPGQFGYVPLSGGSRAAPGFSQGSAAQYGPAKGTSGGGQYGQSSTGSYATAQPSQYGVHGGTGQGSMGGMGSPTNAHGGYSAAGAGGGQGTTPGGYGGSPNPAYGQYPGQQYSSPSQPQQDGLGYPADQSAGYGSAAGGQGHSRYD